MIFQKEIIQLSYDDDPIDIRYDNMFKAVFTKESPQAQGALSRLISAFIERDVSVVSIAANEPAGENTRDRNLRFDINCRTEKGERINVEMSFRREYFAPVRLEYHAARLFTGQDIRGKDKTYTDLKEAYQITILANIRLFPDEKPFHTFEYYDPANRTPLGGRSRIITAELIKLDKIVEKAIIEMDTKEHWAVFFRYLTDRGRRDKINELLRCDEGIAMAGEVLMTISKSEIEWVRRESKLRRELDLQSDRVDAERKGRAEGLIQGEQNKAFEVARRMKSRGYQLEDITESTGLSMETVKNL
jgi:predicted transposase/invertase (TIGR01784 family)